MHMKGQLPASKWIGFHQLYNLRGSNQKNKKMPRAFCQVTAVHEQALEPQPILSASVPQAVLFLPGQLMQLMQLGWKISLASDSHEVFILHFQLRSEGFRLWGQPAMDSLGIFILYLSTRWVWKQGPCSKNMKYYFLMHINAWTGVNCPRIWRNSTESIFLWHPTDLLITSGTSAWSIASKAQVLAICRSAARPISPIQSTEARWHSRAPGNQEKRESSDQVESSDILEPEEWVQQKVSQICRIFLWCMQMYITVYPHHKWHIEKPALNPNIKKISSMGWRAIWNVKSSFSLAFRSQSWRCSSTTSWKCDKLLRRSDLWVWANMLSSQSASRMFKRHDLTTWWPEPCSVAVLCSVASVFVEWKIFESQGIQGRLAMLWCTGMYWWSCWGQNKSTISLMVHSLVCRSLRSTSNGWLRKLKSL